MMNLSTVIPCLNNIQKINHVKQPLSSADINIFFHKLAFIVISGTINKTCIFINFNHKCSFNQHNCSFDDISKIG